jgi:hypothetical protein
MLAELVAVLSAVPPQGSRRDYADAVIEGIREEAPELNSWQI